MRNELAEEAEAAALSLLSANRILHNENRRGVHTLLRDGRLLGKGADLLDAIEDTLATARVDDLPNQALHLAACLLEDPVWVVQALAHLLDEDGAILRAAQDEESDDEDSDDEDSDDEDSDDDDIETYPS